ncbi:hypothetical protein [Ascidiaceihabitans sp.]|uniref:hypothetical protein n=1 Tax=Ascidiaceihabitans sp. TaxID=1872644 RepID=UPI00329A4A48
MKRRTFLTTLTALAAAPALPTAAASSVSAKHLATAKLLARCHDRASPEMLKRLMQLDTQTATNIYQALQNQNIVTSGLDGIARATNPLNSHCITNEATAARRLLESSFDLKNRLQRFAKRKWDEIEAETDEGTPPEQVDAAN